MLPRIISNSIDAYEECRSPMSELGCDLLGETYNKRIFWLQSTMFHQPRTVGELYRGVQQVAEGGAAEQKSALPAVDCV